MVTKEGDYDDDDDDDDEDTSNDDNDDGRVSGGAVTTTVVMMGMVSDDDLIREFFLSTEKLVCGKGYNRITPFTFKSCNLRVLL